ncbi:MAG: ATP-dependent Clp protease ATP-binding subunit [Ruminococcaceae bacterium]|nr:ATP-dependent Clp protease ATP-binding subunit [Oscillospiraceae bacterium]
MILLLKEAEEMLDFSRVIATNLGHSFIGTEHLLLALLGKTKSREMLEKYGLGANYLNYSEVMDEVIRINGQGERLDLCRNDMTKTLEGVLFKSYIYARSHGAEKASTADVVHILFKENDSTAIRIINKCKVDRGDVKNTIMKTFSLTYEKISEMRKTTPITNSYTSDITLLAIENKLDPVLERDLEINRVIQILLRKNKNNPCLVGEAGVGKSSIAEGLAQRIVEGKVPHELSEKRIVSLNIAMLLSGAKYRGDFEERIGNILSEIKKSGNIILVIDEIHNIVNTGAGEGTLDAANILKPELARGEISIIGATTFDEYAGTIEKDRALDRRFQRVTVNEPSEEACIKILKGLKPKYERFHKVKIEDEALKCALEISINEIKNRFLPDKAIDLIDEGAALIKINGKPCLTAEDIKQMFYKDRRKCASCSCIEEYLNKNILGQKNQVKEIARTLASGLFGVRKKDTPLSFLFVGTSGCGKTSTAIKVSEFLFGKNSVIKIDMGEFTEQHSVSKLIGSPPGYVGYEDKGILINEISKRHSGVFLFDEIEKAHFDVIKVILNILDTGISYDNRGKAFDFSKCVFIFTSNVGFEKNVSGFVEGSFDARNELTKTLGASFCGRIDKIIPFEAPNSECSYAICRKMSYKLKDLCKKQGMELYISEDVMDKLVVSSKLKALGYRNLKKMFELTVEREVNLAFAEHGNKIKKITVFLNEEKEISSFCDFGKLNLENNSLSMYNNQKRID